MITTQALIPLAPADLYTVLDTINRDLCIKQDFNHSSFDSPYVDVVPARLEDYIPMISLEPVKPLLISQVRDLEGCDTTKNRTTVQRHSTVVTLAKFTLPDEIQQELERATNTSTSAVKSVKDLFNYIADPKKNVSVIIIGGWAEVLAETKLSLIEVIGAVNTIIQCSGKSIKLAVGINSQVDATTIQEIRRMPIDYIWPGSMEFSLDVKVETMKAMLAGEPFTHPKLDALLKPRRVKSAQTGQVELTPRQHQIMEIVSQRGASNKVIARMLGITESTVKLHMSGILKKYGVRNRTQLALFVRDKAEA